MVTTSTKRLFFIAGDVGGARALLPVIRECERQNLPFWVAANGYIINEAPPHWPLVPLPVALNAEELAKFLTDLDVGVLTFGSSVHDTRPLTVARKAKQQNIPVVHVLDNWTGYRRRLEHDGLPMLVPDVYTLMDEMAYEGAKADGIDPQVLCITGHPALASLHQVITAEQREKNMPKPPFRLLFVSEPVAVDQGRDPGSPDFRGYTETQVLGLLCETLAAHADHIQLSILPHPREAMENVKRTFEETRGRLRGEVLLNGKGPYPLLEADGVAGMASLLLYEAWLAGKPVLSLQPELRRNDLRMLAGREGVYFADTREGGRAAVMEWLASVRKHDNQGPHPDLMRHLTASHKISGLLKERLAAHGSKNGPMP